MIKIKLTLNKKFSDILKLLINKFVVKIVKWDVLFANQIQNKWSTGSGQQVSVINQRQREL